MNKPGEHQTRWTLLHFMDLVHLIAQVEQILELQADPMDLVDQVDWVACN